MAFYRLTRMPICGGINYVHDDMCDLLLVQHKINARSIIVASYTPLIHYYAARIPQISYSRHVCTCTS